MFGRWFEVLGFPRRGENVVEDWTGQNLWSLLPVKGMDDQNFVLQSNPSVLAFWAIPDLIITISDRNNALCSKRCSIQILRMCISVVREGNEECSSPQPNM
jgi:hypothetical protein